jgi:hypothetical protein
VALLFHRPQIDIATALMMFQPRDGAMMPLHPDDEIGRRDIGVVFARTEGTAIDG